MVDTHDDDDDDADVREVKVIIFSIGGSKVSKDPTKSCFSALVLLRLFLEFSMRGTLWSLLSLMYVKV